MGGGGGGGGEKTHASPAAGCSALETSVGFECTGLGLEWEFFFFFFFWGGGWGEKNSGKIRECRYNSPTVVRSESVDTTPLSGRTSYVRKNGYKDFSLREEKENE